MKELLCLLFFAAIVTCLRGQEQVILEKGAVSFLSSRNVYVKFKSTKGIDIGDTLFIRRAEELAAALVVENKSSTSTVCRPLLPEKMKVSDEVFAKTTVKKEKAEKPTPPEKREEPQAPIAPPPVVVPEEEEELPLHQERISGRISAASYSNLSDYQDVHRMRYAFILRGNNLKNSKFSTDNHITFRHTYGEWQEVKENFNSALKVYGLSVSYDIDSSSSLTLGRKINRKISSIGAIDGLQYEKGWGNFILGGIAGSRPDYSDYSLNLHLLQFGAYASWISRDPARFHQTTFGFIEQQNKGNTDRRFVYFQHTGNLAENLNLFGSVELDLYEKIHEEAQSTLSLTNLFVSLRYRPSRKWRLSVSYDNRRNIIYYESYKSFIDQLIEDETRQGLRFGVSYRPFRFATMGVNTSWRFQKSNSNSSKNMNAYLNIARIPLLAIRASITANFLQTNYLDSKIFGIRLSRDIIRRKLSGDLYFRQVDYQYNSNETTVKQKIGGASFSWRILKQLSFSLYYEGTFDNRGQAFHRFNTRIIQRF